MNGHTTTGERTDVEELLASLDLATQVSLLTGATYWTTRAAPAAGLRSMVLSDGPVGVRGQWWDEQPSATLPSPTAMAASWDEPLVHRLGGLLAAEARRKGVDVLLGPTVNLQRSPLAGRHFEYLSEDPLLTGRVGAALVRGLQAGGVAATAKHYVANDSETKRFTVDVRIDDRTLREVYLAPFEQLVVDGGAWVVMVAYNQVNGATMTDNALLTDPLLTEWRFDGVVVSDWSATRSTAASALAGMGLVMPGPGGPWSAGLLAAVRAGAVPRDLVADKARRLLRLAGRVGALGGAAAPAVPAVQSTEDAGQPTEQAARPAGDAAALLREAAAAAMVLVRNEEEVLPLRRAALRRVAVLGANATEPAIHGGGSVGVVPPYTISPLDGLRTALGDAVELTSAVGAHHADGLRPATSEVLTCPRCGEPGMAVRYLTAGGEDRLEHRRVGRLIWFGEQMPHGATVEISARFRAPTAGRWRFGFTGTGRSLLGVGPERVIDEDVRPDVHGFAASFLDPPQRSVDRDLAEGEEIDLVLVHQPAPDLEFAKLVLGVQAPRQPGELALAVDAAREADAAIVVVGTNERIETEGRDRTSLTLPPGQDDLVRAVAQVNRRTIVVVNAGAPVALPWRNDVAAVLLTWFPGQEFGNALADVLLGDAEPGGRLPNTWGAHDDDVPVFSTRPAAGRLQYAEGLHVGYRAWLRSGVAPAYPFGAGMGYTTWSYLGMEVADEFGPGTDVDVTVRLCNTGRRRGKEVVQVYLARPDSAVDRPVLWLAGFGVVRADPGQDVAARIRVAARAFQHWSVADGCWLTEPGAFQLTAGRSTADRPLGRVVTAVA
jgi:beta-glucosidase